MMHFPSSLHNPNNALPRRFDSLQLNATQQKSASHPIFVTIEEELHDARRVHSHGQEEDLRLALNMLIDRLSQLSTLLSDAYKTTADLEVQLNVAKSNLQLVISNNEMLEDALKREPGGVRDVGWRRTSARAYTTDDALASPRTATATHFTSPSGDYAPPLPPPAPTPVPAPAPSDSPAQESSRFFKFRFTGSSPNPGAASSSTNTSRPGTPVPAHASSSSLSLSLSKEKEQLEELERALEKEKKAREAAKAEKEALEAELESLSQALFEEANKMVASERIRRADVEAELHEARAEQDALRSALRLLEDQHSRSHSRAGSEAGSPGQQQQQFHTPPTSAATPESPSASSSSSSSPHLPASTSPLSRRLPPPEPLTVPTTPFDYSATFVGGDNDMAATPRRAQPPLGGVRVDVVDDKVEGGGERERGGGDGGWEEEGQGQDVFIPIPGAGKGREGEDGLVLVSSPEAVSSYSNKSHTPPHPLSPQPTKLPNTTPLPGETQMQRRPLPLFLSHEHGLELEHERDPWADAPSTARPRAVGVGAGGGGGGFGS